MNLYSKGLPQPSEEVLDMMRQLNNLVNLRLEAIELAFMGLPKATAAGNAGDSR